MKKSIYVCMLFSLLFCNCKKDNNNNNNNNLNNRMPLVNTLIDSFYDANTWIIDSLSFLYDNNNELNEIHYISGFDNGQGKILFVKSNNTVNVYDDFVDVNNLYNKYYLNSIGLVYGSTQDNEEFTFDSQNRLIYFTHDINDNPDIFVIDTINWIGNNIDNISEWFLDRNSPDFTHNTYKFEYDFDHVNTTTNLNFGLPYFGLGLDLLFLSNFTRYQITSTKNLCTKVTEISEDYYGGNQRDTIEKKFEYTFDNQNRVISNRIYNLSGNINRVLKYTYK